MSKEKRIKRLALECILLSMEEIKSNLETCISVEQITANAEAMEHLANAYSLIERR